MIELLMRYGARVPDIAKWARAYYFKHYDIAALLLTRGMNPNHMTWHRTTLLHDMAWEGDIRKLSLLLDHGANIDAVDDNSARRLSASLHGGQARDRVTPHQAWSRPEQIRCSMVNPARLGAEKGHVQIEVDLRDAGAQQ